MDERDYERFQMLLYTCNSIKPFHISNLSQHVNQGPALPYVLEQIRDSALVDIGAYCLMPNHLHLALREVLPGGITAFMQKLGTGYTMYFNKKYERTGSLFSGRFKAKHVSSDAYLKRLINYIHANPAELYEPKWKEGVIKNSERLEKRLNAYPYSSLPEYEGADRPHHKLVSKDALLEVLDYSPSIKSLLNDARAFYGDGEVQLF